MNKRVITVMAAIGGTVGASIPMLVGDSALLDGWTVLGGLIGGLAGIWLGAWLSKRY